MNKKEIKAIKDAIYCFTLCKDDVYASATSYYAGYIKAFAEIYGRKLRKYLNDDEQIELYIVLHNF